MKRWCGTHVGRAGGHWRRFRAPARADRRSAFPCLPSFQRVGYRRRRKTDGSEPLVRCPPDRGESVKGGLAPRSQKETRNRNSPPRAAGAQGSFDSQARSAWRFGRGAQSFNEHTSHRVPDQRPPSEPLDLVPKGGFEPPRDNSHTPLKRTCLPFHHFGSGEDRQDFRLPDAEL